MAIVLENLKKDVSRSVGDLANQYNTEIELEIVNSMRDLTVTNTFYWNILNNDFTPSNLTVTFNDKVSRVLHIIDTTGDLIYVNATPERFYQYLNNRNANSMFSGDAVPFIMGIDSDLNDTIKLGRVETDTTSLNITYTTYYENLETDLQKIPERLYAYLYGKTCYNLLVRLDNPDRDLIGYYEKMAMDSLRREIDFSKNRALISLNQNFVSPSMINNNNSTGI